MNTEQNSSCYWITYLIVVHWPTIDQKYDPLIVPLNLNSWELHFDLPTPQQSSKWKFELTCPIKCFNLFLYSSSKNWKIYWSEQSFTGLGPGVHCEDYSEFLYIMSPERLLKVTYDKIKSDL